MKNLNKKFASNLVCSRLKKNYFQRRLLQIFQQDKANNRFKLKTCQIHRTGCFLNFTYVACIHEFVYNLVVRCSIFQRAIFIMHLVKRWWRRCWVDDEKSKMSFALHHVDILEALQNSLLSFWGTYLFKVYRISVSLCVCITGSLVVVMLKRNLICAFWVDNDGLQCLHFTHETQHLKRATPSCQPACVYGENT